GDFFEYADKVEYGLLKTGGAECVNTIKEGLEAFHKLVASTKPDDVAQLTKLFKPCTPIKDDRERMTLEANIYFPFEGVAQANDYAPYNLKSVCDDFKAPGKTPLEKVAAWADRSLGSATCADLDYDASWVNYLKDTTLTTTAIDRQWTYQTCNEFGFGQNAASAKGMFKALAYVTPELSQYEPCKAVFGINDLLTRVDGTNKKYGGFKIDVENVIFPTGTFDGWAGLALSNVTGTVNPKSEVVDIEGTSHCGDMSAPKATDSGPLVWAHQRVESFVDGLLRKKC
ncbi:hypothetical protein As57867_016276, partial [Aphanomyces stellatus]